MSDLSDYLRNGGVPRYRDLPDYWQGLVTNIKNTWQDAENLDDTHGYISYIWIPEETYSVVVMKLAIFAEKFRAYSKSALAGGGTVVTSTVVTPSHTHDVNIGTKTSAAAGSHRHLMFYYTTTGPELWLYNYTCLDQDGNVLSTQMYAPEAGKHMYTYEAAGEHSHEVNIGAVTSEAGGGSHSHDVEIPDHTHDIDFGIYEEDISGRTLSAKLYDPDGNLLHDFGTILEGEGNTTLDLTDYFSPLKYGFYRLELSASGRMRVRLVYYELCRMYID